MQLLTIFGKDIIGLEIAEENEIAVIHTAALEEVFQWFIKACKRYKVQVFMSTHSIEVIDAILESHNPENSQGFLKESLRVTTI